LAVEVRGIEVYLVLLYECHKLALRLDTVLLIGTAALAVPIALHYTNEIGLLERPVEFLLIQPILS
jgi:hypothetical protein